MTSSYPLLLLHLRQLHARKELLGDDDDATSSETASDVVNESYRAEHSSKGNHGDEYQRATPKKRYVTRAEFGYLHMGVCVCVHPSVCSSLCC